MRMQPERNHYLLFDEGQPVGIGFVEDGVLPIPSGKRKQSGNTITTAAQADAIRT